MTFSFSFAFFFLIIKIFCFFKFDGGHLLNKKRNEMSLVSSDICFSQLCVYIYIYYIPDLKIILF